MGLLNVYQFRLNTTWHLPFRFKASFYNTLSDAGGRLNTPSIMSMSVKSISKPHFSLGTDSINQYYGTTRFVMPTIEFDKATVDITFVEEDSCEIENFLLSCLGNANNSTVPTKMYIRIDEYDMSMTEIISSRIYTCSIKSVDLPEFSRTSKATIVNVTAHFIVYEIINVSLTLDDMITGNENISQLEVVSNKSNADSSGMLDAVINDSNFINSSNTLRLVADESNVKAARVNYNMAVKETDLTLSGLYNMVLKNDNAADIFETFENSGYEEYKKDIVQNSNIEESIKEDEYYESWNRLSDSNKMRYIMRSQGIDVTNGISEEQFTVDKNGKTEKQRLLDMLALINERTDSNSEDENEKQIALAGSIIEKVSMNEFISKNELEHQEAIAKENIKKQAMNDMEEAVDKAMKPMTNAYKLQSRFNDNLYNDFTINDGSKEITIKAKKTADVTNLSTEMHTALLKINNFYKEINKDMVITSGNDSKHGRTSLHYKNKAVDIRTKNLTNEEKQKLINRLKSELYKNGYDVLLEGAGTNNEHLHVEFDPTHGSTYK